VEIDQWKLGKKKKKWLRSERSNISRKGKKRSTGRKKRKVPIKLSPGSLGPESLMNNESWVGCSIQSSAEEASVFFDGAVAEWIGTSCAEEAGATCTQVS
jgi:hypothetical protein